MSSKETPCCAVVIPVTDETIDLLGLRELLLEVYLDEEGEEFLESDSGSLCEQVSFLRDRQVTGRVDGDELEVTIYQFSEEDMPPEGMNNGDLVFIIDDIEIYNRQLSHTGKILKSQGVDVELKVYSIYS